MRKLFVLLAVLVFATTASAQVLINDSLTSAPGAWTKVGNIPNAAVSNDRGGDGDWKIGGSDGSGASAPYSGYYYQSFNVAPGVYTVSMSGWVKSWAGWWSGEDWQWIQDSTVELWIDGVKIDEGKAGNGIAWDTWTFWSHEDDHVINSTIEARLGTVKGNNQNGGGTLGAIFWDSRYDDVSLTIAPVPEPSSMLALGTGLMGLAGFAFRRRK